MFRSSFPHAPSSTFYVFLFLLPPKGFILFVFFLQTPLSLYLSLFLPFCFHLAAWKTIRVWMKSGRFNAVPVRRSKREEGNARSSSIQVKRPPSSFSTFFTITSTSTFTFIPFSQPTLHRFAYAASKDASLASIPIYLSVPFLCLPERKRNETR